MRVAIYCRVSTSDQSVEMQRAQLLEYVARRGWELTGEYTDEGISGTKDRRPGLDRLMDDARKRTFDAVLVWKFDRFARSVSHLLRALEEFKELGIEFASYSENLDTSTPMGKAMFTILGALAELERSLILERTHAGRAVARKRGVKFGRKSRVTPEVAQRIRALRASGQTYSYISELLDIGEATISRALQNG